MKDFWLKYIEHRVKSTINGLDLDIKVNTNHVICEPLDLGNGLRLPDYYKMYIIYTEKGSSRIYEHIAVFKLNENYNFDIISAMIILSFLNDKGLVTQDDNGHITIG